MIYRLFLLFSLLLSFPIWTACSGAEATSEVMTPIPTVNTSAMSSPTVTSSTDSLIVPELSETYTGNNELVDATLTVNYPTDWAAQGSGTQLLLASGEPESIDANENALVIQIMPIASEMLQDLAEVSAESLVSQAIQDTVGQAVVPTATTVNDREAAYASAESDSNATFVYAIQIDESVFVVLTAIKTQTFTADDEVLIMAIAETIQYEVGAIPESQ